MTSEVMLVGLPTIPFRLVTCSRSTPPAKSLTITTMCPLELLMVLTRNQILTSFQTLSTHLPLQGTFVQLQIIMKFFTDLDEDGTFYLRTWYINHHSLLVTFHAPAIELQEDWRRWERDILDSWRDHVQGAQATSFILFNLIQIALICGGQHMQM